MNSSASAAETHSDCEVVSTRVVSAPQSRVWRAWTEPNLLAAWWGPKGFRNTFEVFEPKPGGQWRFTMHGPDGTNYKNESVFIEVTEPTRIVLNHISHPKFHATATFDDLGAKARITFRMRFESAAICAQLKPLVIPANEENFDRIEAELAKMA